MKEFLTDVETLRKRARENMDKGSVTDAYGAEKGIDAQPAADEFLQHAGEEEGHANLIAARITQLGGEPDFNPDTLSGRSHSEYNSSTELREMIQEDLVAERVAIASYTEVIAWLGDGDPTTRRMLEEILAMEEEHAEDMLDLLSGLN